MTFTLGWSRARDGVTAEADRGPLAGVSVKTCPDCCWLTSTSIDAERQARAEEAFATTTLDTHTSTSSPRLNSPSTLAPHDDPPASSRTSSPPS